MARSEKKGTFDDAEAAPNLLRDHLIDGPFWMIFAGVR